MAGRTWDLAVFPLAESFRPGRLSSRAALIFGLLLTCLLTSSLAERKRAEQELKASEERHRSLVCNIPDVVWTADAQGRFTFMSPNIEQLSGFGMEEIIQHGASLFFECVHPDDSAHVRQAFQALFSQAKPYDVECRVRRKSGEWIWVPDRSLATYERNRVRYADGLLSDITARKRVEDRLRVQYEAMHALADCNTLGEATPKVLR